MTQQMPGNPYDLKLQQFAQGMRGEIQQVLDRHAGFIRHHTAKQLEVFDARLGELSKIAQALAATRDGGEGISWERRTDRGIVRIEDIPGRRVPYVMLVDIPIGNNTTSQREQSVTISQEGPFVAVKRMATFQSSLQYQVTTGSTTAIFSGRSFGRYRPIHSAWDLNDSQGQGTYDGASMFLTSLTGDWGSADPLPTPIMPAAAPQPVITGAPPIVSAASWFRTMEFDGRILVINAGSSYPRQNISVPSSMWTPEINAPQELGALDFFERGEIITVQVQPNHVNNPPAGNANGNTLFNLGAASTPWPFENGQYDPHEGIVTPTSSGVAGLTINALGPPRVVAGLTTDVIQRLPDGILTIGWEGYRIIQPVGPV
jgi:hypothetical protein